jgi:hypothetical protein
MGILACESEAVMHPSSLGVDERERDTVGAV